MPRKKAEPEVLQEETVQPEITDIEELTPAEQPGLAPQIEEPVQPYGEEESSAAEELPEPSEPEKKSFYDLDFRALDQDLSPEQRQEWNTIYASFRSRSVMRGTIIGARKNKNLFDTDGRTTSLNNSLKTSAKACNKPNGPI